MGMTIDEYIKRMGDIRSNYDRWSMLGLTPNEAKAFDMSIDIMRKYQKIEQIYREWFSDTGRTSADAYERIGEVIKDGNDTK